MDAFQPSDAELATLDALVDAERERLRSVHDAMVAAVGSPPSAGILVKHPDGGVWMAEQTDRGKVVLGDVWGKVERTDATAWNTAVRECREECGIDFSDHLLSPHDEALPLKKRDGETFGAVFAVESYQTPKITGDERILRHCLVRGAVDPSALHPRLRFACGMQSKMRALAAQ